MKKSAQRAARFIHSWLDFRMRQVDIPGVSVAIYHDNDVVFRKAYGCKDLETEEPLAPHHLLRAASLSKLFAATAIMQLYERGKLQLDDPAAKHCTWLRQASPRELSRITIHQLLTHTSGLPRDGTAAGCWLGARPFPNTSELHSLINGTPLYATTVSKYSNLAFGLIGEIVASASGQLYDEYIREHIIEPLHLTHTYPEYHPDIDSQLATGYTRSLEQTRQAYPKDIRAKAFIAGGGVCTTPEDICLLLASRFPGDTRILSEASKKLLHGQHAPMSTHPEQDGYRGYGCAIVPIEGRKYVSNIGSFPGHHSIFMADMERRLAVAVFTTSNDAVDKEIVRGILSTLRHFEQAEAAAPDPALLPLEGRFLSGRGADEFVAVGQKLVAVQSNSWQPFSSAEMLEPVDSTTWRIKTARHSDYAEGEPVIFHMENDKTNSVTYAGTTLLPEATYLKRWRK